MADEVIPQVHDEAAAFEEIARSEHRMGQTERRLLVDVGASGTESRPVTDLGLHLGSGVPRDDPDISDPGGHQGVDNVKENGPVADGNQLFGARVRDRAQPGSLPPTEDQPFERSGHSLVVSPRSRSVAREPPRVSRRAGWCRSLSDTPESRGRMPLSTRLRRRTDRSAGWSGPPAEMLGCPGD